MQSKNRKRKSAVRLGIALFCAAWIVAMMFPMVCPTNPRDTRVADVSAEIMRMQSGLTMFKASFGSDAPSGLTLQESGDGWDAKSRSFIRRLWPQFNFAVIQDLNGDGDTSDTISLNGAECLVFFLGGLRDRSGVLIGFSKNPISPFDTNSQNRIVFFEFDRERLTDVDGDGMAEYGDQLTGSPFLYLNVRDGTDADLEGAMVTRYVVVESSRTVQVISAGRDGEYGTGGTYSQDMNFHGDRNAERDNLTNFSNGPLER